MPILEDCTRKLNMQVYRMFALQEVWVPSAPKPFWFQLFWLENKELMPLMKIWWKEEELKGKPGYILGKKLSTLKERIKGWARANFGFVEERVRYWEGRLQHFEIMEEAHTLSDYDKGKRDEAAKKWKEALRDSKIFWAQKAHSKWRSKGDKSTNFFHQWTNSKQRLSKISHLVTEGGVVEDMSVIKDHLVSFYENLYKEKKYGRPLADGVELNKLEEGEAEELQKDFTENEILQALGTIEGDKTPGPDGFPMVIFKKCWGFMKKEIMEVVRELQENGFFSWRLNNTFISLVPKKDGDKEVTDFRPISLLSGIYKIVARTLALRLKWVMGKLVSEHQMAGVEGRQIQENVLIANELLDTRFKSKEAGLIYKIDFAKAFDHVSWEFIEYLFVRFGFGVRWRKWVKACLATARFSVLINGSPVGRFKSSRGLRQGDPLSPMIFALVMEVLTWLVLKAQMLGMLKGFRAVEGGMEVPILQYADDTLIMIEAKREEVLNLKGIMMWFEALPGLHVNYAKSRVYLVNEVNNGAELVNLWGCHLGSFPDVYLGMPLGGDFKNKMVWRPMIDRLRDRLAIWKRKYLTKGGRMVLIKSTLESIPVYLCSLFTIPLSIVKEVDRIARNFLWGTTSKKKKFCLVSWKKICLPFERGGLGFRKLKEVNTALLMKWLWLLAEGGNKIWIKIIKEKYGMEENRWVAKDSKTPFGCGVWRGVLRVKNFFMANVRFQLGDGRRISFWHDNWTGSRSLKETFPTLYRLSTKKYGVVREFTCNFQNKSGWYLFPSRILTSQEAGMAHRLFQHIQECEFADEVEDRILWQDGAKSFSVKGAYR